MKIILKALCTMLLLANCAHAQELNGARFMRELQQVMDDANDGFVKIKASDDAQTNWINLIYHTTYRMLDGSTSYIYYHEQTYLKYSKETEPESYFYFQSFNNGTPQEYLLQTAPRRYWMLMLKGIN